MDILISKVNEVYIKIHADDSILHELQDRFTFEIPGAKFTPKFKSGMWDGKLRLLNLRNRQIYAGLYDLIISFAEQNNYSVEYVPSEIYPNDPRKTNELDRSEIEKWVHELEHTSKGKKVEVYPHQLDAIFTGLNEDRLTLISPTSSGKSLIIYSLIRWHLQFKRKILLIVPTTQLCEQMYSDIGDYSSESKWNVEKYCQKLYSGFSKTIENPVLISTWQSVHSILKTNPEWVSQFDTVLVDEAHLAKGPSLTGLLEKMPDTKYRIGLTGTLDDAIANKLIINGLFGRVYQVTTTRELMDAGKVVDLDIRGIILNHTEEDRKLLKGAEFKDEIAFLTEHPRRNKFIANLALATKGNTLVLCTLIDKHLKPLAELIKQNSEDRNVFLIYGNIKAEDREAIRLQLENETDALVLASFATTSTGVNMPSIENIILAASGKSKIRNLQSIGRGLRLKQGKTKCKLFDITDNLSWKRRENHTFKHFKERIDQYSKEQFEYKIIEVTL